MDNINKELDRQIEYYKNLNEVLKDTRKIIQAGTIEDNAVYYIYNFDKVYNDEEKMKEDHIEDYDGLDDGMSDWLPDYEEVKGKDLKIMLEKNDLSLEW
jgi:hypothetical protein